MTLFGKTKLPADWPSPLHNKCSKSSCTHPNPPQPAPGTYSCLGCRKGTYVVTYEMAREADARCHRIFEFDDINRRKLKATQEAAERISLERDYTRYQREDKTDARREKWAGRPGSPLGRCPATKRACSPVSRSRTPAKNIAAATATLLDTTGPPTRMTQSKKVPRTVIPMRNPPNSALPSTPYPPPGVPQAKKSQQMLPTYTSPMRNSPSAPPVYANPPPNRQRTVPTSHPSPRADPHSVASLNPGIRRRQPSVSPVPPSRPRPPRSPCLDTGLLPHPYMQVLDDAQYYASRTWVEARGYMPRRIDSHGPF